MLLCEDCLLANNREVRWKAIKKLALSIVIMVAGPYCFAATERHAVPGWLQIYVGFLSFSAYWGWLFLSERFPRLSEGSITSWFVYILVKLPLSGVVGMFAAPYEIFRILRTLQRVNDAAAFVRAHPVNASVVANTPNTDPIQRGQTG